MGTCLRQSEQKARKQHKCVWCGEAIEIGETYSYWAGIFEGEFQTNKMHLECEKVCSSKENDYCHDGFNPYEYKRGSLEEK